MATGLLILGFGAATRLLTYLVGLDKTYEATIRLGESTTTDDAEGESTGRFPVAFTDDELLAAVGTLTGDILQRPSTVSAIKVDGKRAYALARAGRGGRARRASGDRPRIRRAGRAPYGGCRGCGKSWMPTCASPARPARYIRALARDLGTALGSGGHLTALRRTSVGPFDVASAAPVEDAAVLAPAEVAGALFPVAELDEQRAWSSRTAAASRCPEATRRPSPPSVPTVG